MKKDLFGFVSRDERALTGKQLRLKEKNDKLFVSFFANQCNSDINKLVHPSHPNSPVCVQPTLEDVIRNGLPVAFRFAVWMRFVDSRLDCQKSDDICDNDKKIINPTVRSQIENDLDRTFPNHEYFSSENVLGMTKLANALCTLAIRFPEIGYCQGLNFVVGFISLFFRDEADCLKMSVSVLNSLPSQYYTENMQDIHIDSLVIEHLLRNKHPQMHAHFTQLSFDLALIVNSWLISMCFCGGQILHQLHSSCLGLLFL